MLDPQEMSDTRGRSVAKKSAEELCADLRKEGKKGVRETQGKVEGVYTHTRTEREREGRERHRER